MTEQAGVRPLPPQHRRYPVRLIAVARRLYNDGNGLTPTQIRLEIAKRYVGSTPTLGTVRRWVIPAEAEYQRELNRLTALRRRRRGGQPMWSSGALEGDALVERMLELRARGLSYVTIATVCEMYHGSTLNADQVRTRLRKIGVQPQPAKSEAMRRHWAEQRLGAVSAEAA